MYLSGFDVYNNRVALSNVPEELHFKVGQLDGEFLELSVAIPRECISLSANNATLELKVKHLTVHSDPSEHLGTSQFYIIMLLFT